MRIKNRLSPYPILDNFGDDYINSSFLVDYEVSTQFAEVYGKLIFALDNKDIQDLIVNGQAEYVAHVECPSTCYRVAYSSNEPEIEFKMDVSNVSNVIEIRTFVTLKQDIIGFSSSKFHPDYEGQIFNLAAHQIIAIGTAKNFDIQKDDRDLDSLPSILRIVKMEDKKKGSLSVDTDGDDHVVVGLSNEVFDLYARLGKSTFKSTAFSLVLLPALVIVLQRMCHNRDDEAYTSMHWYHVIQNMLKINGYSIEDLSIENDSLLTICQSIFADPIERSFKELDICSERM
ncbi:MAG: hypothetical protein Q4B70_18025 [Lachnospiraceae bacterium]|nr:hypothetical protein [Lachnospiraceae bacterium]